MTALLSEGWEHSTGGKLEFIPDPDEMLRRALTHIDSKRAELGLVEYDPARFGESEDAWVAGWLAAPAELRNPYTREGRR